MRADKYLSTRFESRTKASEAIEKGLVLVNGKRIKPKDEIGENDVVTFVQAEETFVSNGCYKLSRAIKTFHFDCKDKIFADIGASTGGFTDCLLQNGAKKVYAVDVGESLLHDKLKNDDRIFSMENVNARYLKRSDFSERLNGVVADVSFISLRLIFPVIKEILSEDGDGFILIKPQFECDNQHIGKSGIVRVEAHPKIIEKVIGYAEENGLYIFGIINAPIRKGKNVEYVLWVKPIKTYALSKTKIIENVKTILKSNKIDALK